MKSEAWNYNIFIKLYVVHSTGACLVCFSLWGAAYIILCLSKNLFLKNQQTRELISAQKQSHINTTTKTWVTYSNSHLACEQTQGTQTPPEVHPHRYMNSTRGTSSVRICTLYVLVCQVRTGSSGFCCVNFMCDVFQVLIYSLCLSCTGTLGLIFLFQIVFGEFDSPVELLINNHQK